MLLEGERQLGIYSEAKSQTVPAFTRSMVFTYSENTAQYSLFPPKVRRMKKAPDILSSSPTNFIPRKSKTRGRGKMGTKI